MKTISTNPLGVFELMHTYRKILLSAVFFFSYLTSYSQLVTQDANGKLIYKTYANKGQSNSVNTVPDFSRSGYRGGGVKIPDNVPVRETVRPGGGDDGARIQAAIDKVSRRSVDRNGFRGAVLLKSGTYEVKGVLTIKKSGVVLRGEGQGSSGGTKIIAVGTGKRSLIVVDGGGKSEPISGSVRSIDQSFVPVGSKKVKVTSVGPYRVGQMVIIERRPNQKWLDDMDNMGRWGWTPEAYVVGYERRIKAINGNTLTLDAPFVQTFEDQYGNGKVLKYDFSDRLTNVGVENLRLESEFKSNSDEDHGWIGVNLRGVSNSWVRKVTAQYFGYGCVRISHSGGIHSAFVTVEDCAMLDPKSKTTGGRKYSFEIAGSGGGQFILFQRCLTRGGRHDYVTGSRVAGPNVFLDCVATRTRSSIGPHHRYATGILFDNIRGGIMEARNRRSSGTGHGWAGAQTMYWNCSSGTRRMYLLSPPSGINWAIGSIGDVAQDNGLIQSHGRPVLPRSLYLAQLKDRLGQAAVNNITTREQRAGSIWDELMAWNGEELASNGNADPVSGRRIVEVDEATKETSIRLFPNPVSTELHLDISDFMGLPVDYMISDVSGKKILENKFSENHSTVEKINISELEEGVYFMKIRDTERIFNNRFIKN